MNDPDPYKDFTERLKLLSSKRPDLITTTLWQLPGLSINTCTTSAQFTSGKTCTAPSQNRLFSHALVASGAGHTAALEKVEDNITLLKREQ